MTCEEIIEAARKQLPYTSEVATYNYYVCVDDVDSIDCSKVAFGIAPKCDSYHVEFVKHEINGVVIGWQYKTMELRR